ncbi:TetR/AcrR family transcriptional regulator [Pseudooceanicola aestuarii]|uniref:TetR/AcrR family transcriptional regulator n=1 Tax=Pseudooceanicola aestuarii TaxID=2697319 RepID=UPI0013D41DF7|nr:TetR/AcrR family transcriptional regulator [Pseudooceanicola aestuarii]
MRSNLAESPRPDTRDAIRDAAEELFAENGISGVSTRAIAQRAGANLAAVNYHFGNKEKLTLEIFRDVAHRTATQRLASLDRLEAQARTEGRTPRIVDLVESFVAAYTDEDDPRTGRLLAHFVVKHRYSPNEWTNAIVHEELDALALRFIGAIQIAAPHLTKAEAHWRYHLMVGTLQMMLTDEGPSGRIARLSDGDCDTTDRREMRAQIIAFLTAALADTGADARADADGTAGRAATT